MTASQSVYERLAERLRNTPNGFPRTQSGSELQLLARMFTPEQAALASVMHLQREPAADIAARAGVDLEKATATLKGMVRRGLIYAGRATGGLAFGLLPFIVGSYEESLAFLDKDMAEWFEAMMLESQGKGIIDQPPAVHRVIPVEKSIDAEITVLPYERVSELLNNARSFGIRECICRKQKDLIGEGCEHERMNCLNLAPIEGAFVGMPHVQTINRADAERVLREAAAEGLVHCVSNQQNQLYYICNCCACCCGVMRGMIQFGHHHALARSEFLCTVDAETCVGCEACLERCHFHALSMQDGTCVVDPEHCMGCGLCVEACPSDAMRLRRCPPGEHTPPPADHQAWMESRAASRGVPLQELL